MSEWYDPDDGDVDVDHENKCVNIWVMGNDQGSVYVNLSFDRIKKIAVDAGFEFKS